MNMVLYLLFIVVCDILTTVKNVTLIMIIVPSYLFVL